MCTTDDRGDDDLVDVLRTNGATRFSDRSAPGMVVEAKVDATTHASIVTTVDDPEPRWCCEHLCRAKPVYAHMGFRTFTTCTQWAIAPPPGGPR